LKKLIRAFGFVYWDAPGEAEAEAAMLQRCGVVDVVFTEDVDALMFGAGRVGREVGGVVHGKSHVVVYEDVEEKTGLDRDGLVLCAMMSGGDYLPAGLPNCGPKIAVEVPLPKKTKKGCGRRVDVVDCESGVWQDIDDNKGLYFLETDSCS
jgi:holliday junction resolvase YEN1